MNGKLYKGVLATLGMAMASAWPMTVPAKPAESSQAVTASELQAMVATLDDGRAAAVLRRGENYLVMTAVRAVPGEPEVHERMADLFIVQEGSAKVHLGGSLAGGRLVSPGEWVGGRISGGEVRPLGPGDLLWIPAGWPHQVTPEANRPFRYLVVKVRTPD
jgi:mannose-6-phosphate isomerase-like protein (cupin superfamily)